MNVNLSIRKTNDAFSGSDQNAAQSAMSQRKNAGLDIAACLQLMGVLSQEDCERIAKVADTSGSSFARAALRRGAIDRSTLLYALGVQQGFLRATCATRRIPTGVSAAENPFSEEAKTIRQLARRLLSTKSSVDDLFCISPFGERVHMAPLVMNLMAAFSQLRRRVLFVDAGGCGGQLSSLCVGSALCEKTALNNTIFSGADLMVASADVAFAGQQGQESLQQNLKNLYKDYEMIFVVTPKFDEGGACENLWRECSKVISVVASGGSDRNVLAKAAKKMRAAGATSCGLIFER